MRVCSGVSSVGVTWGGNLSARKIFDILKMKIFKIRQLNSSEKFSDDLFKAFYKRHVIHHKNFPFTLFNHLTHKIYLFTVLPTKFINFFILVSPLEMVSPRAARPLLSTSLRFVSLLFSWCSVKLLD